jgi:hypothetical protein
MQNVRSSKRIYGNVSISYDIDKPNASAVNKSAITPIIVRATANRTYSYTFTELITATPPYTYRNGIHSDLIKFLNINQLYTLSLTFKNSIGDDFTHLMQPGEVVTVFYNPNYDEWLFIPSIL